ncbi:hypothetical protein [Falsirhodobacter halotolerans]|uniref:hypothetical protein n=1 Tax=Falsirhodobacter halotolerans TaxID=1146892 RepID=UPI001FD4A066|nr:hypothetical protein [Falsirhodobacter halotolerans]MCJ8139562.1 hypothetical protein [Falsirhodobacter halotolerans]
MNTIIPIPHGVMRQLNCDWRIDWRGQSSGEGLDGVEQIFASPFPRWVGSPALGLWGDALRLWRATNAKARGRVNLYRLPLIDRDDIADAYGSTDYAGRPLHGAYGDGPTAKVVGDRAAGSTAVNAAMGFDPIRVGGFISIADWPYVVVDVQPYGAPGNRTAEITIEPPLRRRAVAHQTINLRAHGIFRATEDSMGAIDVGPDGYAQVDLSFAEWQGPGRP